VGASDRDATSFVPLVHEGLGEGVELLNLGHSGDTSDEFITHGHLSEALTQVEQRNGDGDPDEDVKLVTLDIGGNDLLDLYFSVGLARGLSHP
jgi:lysophospholipase L1-like esterase